MAECYAKLLGDCRGRISHEHVVSDGVLALIADANDKLLVSGLAWLPEGEVKELTPAALTTRCLCEEHNSYLSRYDAAAIKFFSALRSALRAAHRGEPSAAEEVAVDGKLIAGWLLKRYLGHASSDQFRSSKGSGAADLEVEDTLVHILFGREAWPSAWRVGITSAITVLDTDGGGSLVLDVGHHKEFKSVGVMEVAFDGVQVRFFRWAPSAKELATVVLTPVRLRFVNPAKRIEHTVLLADAGTDTPREIPVHLSGVDVPA